MSQLEDMMGVGAKRLKKSQTNGGFFYFIFDGTSAAIIVNSTKRDEDGKRTIKEGRKMMNLFKKELKSGHPKFCHGSIPKGEEPLTFLIKKGVVKPSKMKMALKKNTFLHTGVGGGVYKSALMTAKVRMETVPKGVKNVDAAALQTFSQQPEIAALGLQPDELRELCASDTVFDTYIDSLDRKGDEELELEETHVENVANAKCCL